MRSWHRILLGGLLILAVAAAGIALNFGLLGLTQEGGDRVGKLSPRAVFDRSTGATRSPGTTTPSTTTGDDGPTVTDGGDSSGPGGGNDGRTHDADD
jgi:hypothetical protein